VRLPREISAGAASRRAFLADALAAALIAVAAILLAAGIGVVGFGALVVLLVLSAWIAVEALVRAVLRISASHRNSSDLNGDRGRRVDPSR
jgi:hypothetical protein